MQTILAPSPRQAAILAALPLPRHLLIQACAGSGKTTTLGLIAATIPQNLRSVALCFNKAIADEFTRKLPHHVEAKTLHSLGFAAVRAAVRNVRVDDRKLRNVIDSLPSLRTCAETVRRTLAGDLAVLVGLVSDMMVDPTDKEAVADAVASTGRTVEMLNEACEHLPGLLAQMDGMRGVITFSEMIRHPLVHGYALPQFDVVLVDEAQDLNASQHALVARIVKPGGKLIAVGDRAQSIYGFRGADRGSMDRLKSDWDMVELPLDVSFRCPRAVVAEAQTIVGDGIQPSPSAPEGEVIRRDAKALGQTEAELAPGDMVLCRINAPLVPLAFRLIRRGCRALIRGRDLGAGLLALVRRLKAADVGDLIAKARKWADKAIRQAEAADKGAATVQAIEDKVDTLCAFAAESESVADLMGRIEAIFADVSPEGCVLLSTVHKAKGLEAERVVILRPDLLPAPWAKSEADQAQEKNIAYVAITRAKRTLIFQAAPEEKRGGKGRGKGKRNALDRALAPDDDADAAPVAV